MNEPAQNTPLWTRLVLVLACAGAIVAAVLLVGPNSQGATTTTTRVITAEKGVVQSTVSGDGTLQPVTQEDVNFGTSGTLENLYVSSGQQVSKGELLATLNPQEAEVGVQQAEASLQAAEASLQAAESTQATAESASTSSTASANAATATAADAGIVEAGRYPAPAGTGEGATGATGPAGTTAPSGPTTAVTTTVTVTATPHKTAPSGGASERKVTATAPRESSDSDGSSGSGGDSGTGTTFSDSGSNTPSAATLAADVASAQAQVSSAQLDVQSAQQALTDTRLYAPASGVVASVSDVQVGDTISAGSASSDTSDTSDSGSSGSGSTGSGSSGRSDLSSLLGGNSGSSSSSDTGSSSSSSSAFVTIVDPSQMELVVPFTESDIGKLAVGQPATVTVDALTNVELAAHVTNVSLLASSTSSVTTYNVTLVLDQNNSQVKPGMSATAQVVVSQATGAVSVPTTAISRTGGEATVTVQENGKNVTTPVTTGLVGDSTTQILSGVNPGQQIVITQRLNLGSAATTTGAGGLTGGGLGGALTGGGGLFRGAGGGGGGGFARALGGG